MYWILHAGGKDYPECVVLVDNSGWNIPMLLSQMEDMAENMGHWHYTPLQGIEIYDISKGQAAYALARARYLRDNKRIKGLSASPYEIYRESQRRRIIGKERSRCINERVQAQWSVCPTYDVLIGVQ